MNNVQPFLPDKYSAPPSATAIGDQKKACPGTPKRQKLETHLSTPNQTPLLLRRCSMASTSDNCVETPSDKLRLQLGGKGLFLSKMVDANLPVPLFQVVDTETMQVFEQHLLSPGLLKKFLPDDEVLNRPCSLATLKEYINGFSTPEKRNLWFGRLAELIASDLFYGEVKHLGAARVIEAQYNKLLPIFGSVPTRVPVIARSSGVDEDDYGHAQAGKFDSRVKSDENIVRTCLFVLASGYKPQVCEGKSPKPMAIILQHCVDCRFGGVVLSRSSLKDDSIQVEYAPGQPKTVVSGDGRVIPHRYLIKRTSPLGKYEYTPGEIPTRVTLQEQGGHFVEVPTPNPGPDSCQELSPENLQQLHHYIETLENLLMCPVDVEFAINHQGRLFLLQVRPVTHLPGSMQFTQLPRETPAICGRRISEGLCSGHAVTIDQHIIDEHNIDVSSLPEDAVVFARYSHSSMVNPDVLKKVRGFVFQHSSDADHVAISLRQAGIPCMEAGDGFDTSLAEQHQTVTLACGDYNNAPCASIFKGNQTTQIKSSGKTSATQEWPAADSKWSRTKCDFTDPCSGLQWLNQKNNRLLDYFRSDRLINHCLQPGHCLQLSMHPRRKDIMQQLAIELDHFLRDTEDFIEGYERFLQLARGFNLPQELRRFVSELPDLKRKVEKLGEDIEIRTKWLLRELDANADTVNSFRLWLHNCQRLQMTLMKFKALSYVDEINSVHDLILFIHRRFVKATGSVAQYSGQGQVDDSNDMMTCVTFTQPSVCADSAKGLLDDECMEAIGALKTWDAKPTVINMPGTLLVNASLGVHVCNIEALESAEAGKGRTIKLTLTDDFSELFYLQGKFKRFWLLVHLLKAASFEKNSAGLTVSLNEGAGKIMIEVTQFESSERLKKMFCQLCMILSSLHNVDSELLGVQLEEDALSWDWVVLRNRLSDTSKDQFSFKRFLFYDAYNKYYQSLTKCLSTLDENYVDFYNLARLRFNEYYSPDRLREIFKNKDEAFKKDYVHCLLLTIPMRAEPFLEECGWIEKLKNKEEAFRLIRQNGMALGIIPEPHKHDRELTLAAVKRNGIALQYADEQYKDDPEIVLAAVDCDSKSIKFASQRLIENQDFLLEAIKVNRCCIESLDQSLSKNRDFILKACRHNGANLLSASKEIVNDLECLWVASNTYRSIFLCQNIDRNADTKIIQKLCDKKFKASDLKCASQKLKNMAKIMKAAIEQDPWALMYIDYLSHDDKTLLKTAVQKIEQAIKESGSDNYWLSQCESAERQDAYQKWQKHLKDIS